METIGFIGIGNMGSGMSRNIQRAGYPMVVHDIRKHVLKPLLEEGARMATSPAEVARLSDVIFTSLPGPTEVEEVAIGPEGLLEGIKKGSVYVDLSTSKPSLIRSIEPMFRKKGAHTLDGPVSGGTVGAASGNLAILVGGDREVYDRIKPILDAFGDKAFYAGEIGCGAIAKLVHNMISMTLSRVLAEGMTLGVKAGVEPRTLWECVRRGAVGRMSQLHVSLPQSAFRGKFDPPGFALKLARKDVALATELGREFDVPLPFANLTEQVLVQALNRGWGERDSSATWLLQEENAGVEVRVPDIDLEKAGRFISTHPEIE
jgi:3-hydroxyisobutyrate dehydrogenase-like beta-hydroxyacid dehydrogenase